MSGPVSPRSVLAGNGLTWITGGWRLFVKAPGAWIVIIIIVAIISIVCGLIPLLGGLLSPIVSTLLGAGILLAAARQQETDHLEITDLFSVLSHPALKPLLVVGAIYLGLMLLATMVLVAMALGSGGLALLGAAMGGEVDSAAAGFGGMMIALLVFLALLVPILAMYWFAVPLVLFAEFEPWTAMKQSLTACLANILPMLVYGVIGMVILTIASIPLGLGLLVAAPVLAASWLISYQDIFEHPA